MGFQTLKNPDGYKNGSKSLHIGDKVRFSKVMNRNWSGTGKGTITGFILLGSSIYAAGVQANVSVSSITPGLSNSTSVTVPWNALSLVSCSHKTVTTPKNPSTGSTVSSPNIGYAGDDYVYRTTEEIIPDEWMPDALDDFGSDDTNTDDFVYNTQIGNVPREPFATTITSKTWRPELGSDQYLLTQQNQSDDIEIAEGKYINTLSPLVKITPTSSFTDTAPLVPRIIEGEETEETEESDITSNHSKVRELLNDNISLIQNEHLFPFVNENSTEPDYKNMVARKYDYSITTNIKVGNITLEEKLTTMRTALGIQVHGDNAIGKTMRYYMYNRHKIPDKTIAFSKSFTHVFFTRPDCNLLVGKTNPTIAPQCQNHTEAAATWMRYPDLFKLLVDRSNCGDSNNFNMLLSNACKSFNIEDEALNSHTAGMSWNGHTINYGNEYTGREAGEFTVVFEDDKFLSVFNLIKLWMTYIDNVSRGAWKPNYYLNGASPGTTPSLSNSHVFTQTIDYASSCYVFKTSEDGSNLLYWTKYYGIFPINTGSSVLSWEEGQLNAPPKPSIRFKYAFKRDLSPVSLVEFNCNSNIGSIDSMDEISRRLGKAVYETDFNLDLMHTSRPFVGTPFIEMFMPAANPSLYSNRVDLLEQNLAQFRLRFTKGLADNQAFPSDQMIYTPKFTI